MVGGIGSPTDEEEDTVLELSLGGVAIAGIAAVGRYLFCRREALAWLPPSRFGR